MTQWVKTHTEDIDVSILLAYEGYSYWEGVTLLRDFSNTHVAQFLPSGRLPSPRVKKKRFVSRRHIATAVAVDLWVLIKEACFVWC